MKRRKFIKSAASTTMGGLIAGSIPVLTPFLSSCVADTDEIDKYGGWKRRRFKATGFFRLEKKDRWWLVTPEGHAFISFGINHYHDGWWAQEYNLDFWLKKFGAAEFQDENWQKGFQAMALADMKSLGLNTLGVHTNAMSLTNPPLGPVLPYVRTYEPLDLSHYRNPGPERFVDIFSPDFEELCDAHASKHAAPYKDDPYLLGYCMADCPPMTDNCAAQLSTTTWPRELRNLSAKAPGKKAWLKCMKSRYASIDSFNTSYDTSFTSWSELGRAENWRVSAFPVNEQEMADNAAFLLLCVDKYYEVAKRALLKADPNHLFMGDKINGDTAALEEVGVVAAKHVDLISYQCYSFWERHYDMLERIAVQVDIPFLNGDSGFSVVSEKMPNPYGHHAQNRKERAAWIREYCEEAFARQDVVGWHMCGVIDTWNTMPGKETHQHQGLMDPMGEMYPDESEVVRDISSRMYEIAERYLD